MTKDFVVSADGHLLEPVDLFKTGLPEHLRDMAVWEADNYINIVDRKKQIIVSGGENISSIEVENAIAAHPGPPPRNSFRGIARSRVT